MESGFKCFPSGDLLGDILFDSPPMRTTDIVNDERKGLGQTVRIESVHLSCYPGPF